VDYFEEAKTIWHECVPKSGQAITVQGELLRAVEKLRDEAIRNGNGNWDAGFEILLAYLNEKLLDNNLFDEKIIEETTEILKRLKNYNEPYLEDNYYDFLDERVVEYYKHYGSQEHTKNSKLHR
jgi:hypothetical protein